jgi:hypothetical protein
LWAGSKATHGKIISGTYNCLNYCEMFIVYEYTPFTNVASGHITQLGEQFWPTCHRLMIHVFKDK